MFNITYVITEDPEAPGTLLVEVPAIPGCHTFGHSLPEAHKNALDVIRTAIEMRRDLGLPLPNEVESAVAHL